MKKYDLPLKSYETTKPCKTGEKVKGNMLFAMNSLCSRLTVKVVVITPKPNMNEFFSRFSNHDYEENDHKMGGC